MKATDRTNIMQFIGPGILFAGAAIGTSHLVQSTRAGAVYGLGLLVVIILTNVLKYPSYRFGPVYAAVTGRSLIEGYGDIGKWAVAAFALSELVVGFIIIGATAITSAAMLLGLFDSDLDAKHVGAALVVLGMILLRTGGFKLLDRLTKMFVAILTVCTLLATALVLPKIDWSFSAFAFPAMDVPTFAFLIALMGFMPAGMGLSVLNSLWTVTKSKQQQTAITPEQAIIDFNIGYIGAAFLAVCFLLMGAGVLHTTGEAPAGGAAPFAKQVISLYTSSLGSWSGIVVGVSAVSVMFTTLLAILDGFPRMQAASWYCVFSNQKVSEIELEKSTFYWAFMFLMCSGGVIVLYWFSGSFRAFIDFVTICSFIVGPFTALLNHLVINGSSVPVEHRPGRGMNLWSAATILLLSSLALVYLALRFT